MIGDLSAVVAAMTDTEGSADWWAPRDLNPQPRDYESPALTVELEALLCKLPPF
jgi:hypothetical protein